MNKIINFQDWKAEVNGQILTVTKNNESREYDIKEKIVSVDYEEESEYFYIRTFGRTYYQFTFEVNYPSQFIKNFFQETKGFTEDEITELENLDGRDGDCMYLLDHSVYDIAKIYTKADDKDFDEAMENEASNPSVC